jgi:hypothetical protein
VEKSAVKANPVNALAEALLADLLALLSGWQPRDRWWPLHRKHEGIDRLLLVSDDYKFLVGSPGEFIVRDVGPPVVTGCDDDGLLRRTSPWTGRGLCPTRGRVSCCRPERAP